MDLVKEIQNFLHFVGHNLIQFVESAHVPSNNK